MASSESFEELKKRALQELEELKAELLSATKKETKPLPDKFFNFGKKEEEKATPILEAKIEPQKIETKESNSITKENSFINSKNKEIETPSTIEAKLLEKPKVTTEYVNPVINNNINKPRYDEEMDNIIADSIEADRMVQEEDLLAREQEEDLLHYNPYVDDTNPYIDDSNPYINDSNPYIDDSNPYIYTLHHD